MRSSTPHDDLSCFEKPYDGTDSICSPAVLFGSMQRTFEKSWRKIYLESGFVRL